MKRWDIKSAVALLVLSALVFLESLQLDLGRLRNPGPGFFPLYLSLLLGGLSLLLLLKALLQRNGDGVKPLWVGKRWIKVVLCAAGLFSYSAVLDLIGYPIATTLLMVLFFRFIAPQKWYVVYCGSVIIAVVSYVVFKSWLGIQLPFFGVLSF